MMIISFRSAYGSSFYNYKIQNRISCRYKKRQKKKTRTESARIQNQKCGLSKEFRCCRRTDRSCRDRARGSLHSPGSSGLPASGMFLRSLDRVFRDTSDSLAGSHRSVIITPFSSARGTTLAVMASSVSRILPGQEYSIVTAIAAGGTYCNVPLLIPQGQKRKMFLTAEIFLKLFFDTEKATRLFTIWWLFLHF